MQLSRVKKNMITAVCISLSVVLEMAVRVIPGGGSFYGLLHLPVLICALVCGGGHGALCGLCAAVLSAVTAGTPSAAMLPVCIAECVLLGGVAGVLSGRLQGGTLYIATLAAMVIGRVVGSVLGGVLFCDSVSAGIVWATGYFAAALPGAVIQFVLAPGIMHALKNAGVLQQEESGDE